MFPKVEELDHPPEIGRMYSVLCISVNTLHGGSRYLPIFGEGHIDEFDFGNYENGREIHNIGPHGHHDIRFFTDDECKATGWKVDKSLTFYMKHGPKFVNEKPDGTYSYSLRRELREMVREFPAIVWGETPERIKFEKKFENKKLDLNCKRCPHQGTNLDSVRVVDGNILCPLHNLMWDSKDGSLVRKMQTGMYR